MNAKMLSIAAVASVLLGSTVLVQAEERMSGPARATPGHLMQQKGSLPGHPGASGYAPGHRTIGLRDRDDRKHIGRDRDDKMTGFGGRDRGEGAGRERQNEFETA